MDHGILNVPIAKRGGDTLFGIRRADADAAVKAAGKAAVASRVATKAQAKELLAQHQEAIVARHGARFGVKALRGQLDQWAKWEPAKLVTFVNKFLAEAQS